VCRGCGVSFCASARFCSFLSRVLCLELISAEFFFYCVLNVSSPAAVSVG